MMTSPRAKIFYFVHDLTDSAVRKRVAMLKDGGAEVIIIGFYRGEPPPHSLEECRTIALGQTYDGRFLHRLLATLKSVATISALQRDIGTPDIIMARTLEMLAIAVRFRSASCKAPTLVYESLDIHRLLLRSDATGRILRTLEGWLAKRASLLITSSPAFIREYFQKLSDVRCPTYLLENKVYLKDGLPALTLQRPPAPPWKIGWFGAIRCRKSLEILSQLARQMNGQVEVIIRGKPALDQFDDFYQQVSAVPCLRFEGPYKNPDDLESIYSEVHFTWAIDMFEEGLNSSWLLPNRIYEGGLFRSVPLAQANVETGRCLKDLGTGVFLGNPLADQLVSFFKELTPDTYQTLSAKALAVPLSSFLMTGEDSSHLVDKLLSLKGSSL